MEGTQEKSNISNTSSKKLKPISGIGKDKMILQEKSNTGITLIALVVTIVVLLILAGITINLIFSNGGIFDIANQSKIEFEIGALKDRINNVIADWSIERLTKPGITVDNLWDKMVDADIISNPVKDYVSGPEKEGENDVYQVTTNEGYVVEVIVSPDGNVIIGEAVKGDKLPPKIVSVETETGTNNIQVTVTMSRWEEGTISYYYKKDEEKETSYKTLKEDVTDLTANIEGLEQNVVYNIKIVAKNENGNTEKVINERTGELKEGTITQKGETVWSNGTASIELETSETGVTIQYQIDGMEGKWIDYKGPITGLNHNQTVFAVITDGNNISGHTSINILDEKEPIVTVTKGTITTNSIQVNVNSSDAEWGMPSTPTYNYYIKQTSAGDYLADPTHTGTETSYTFTGLTQNTSYDVKVTTTDKAGNEGEGQVTNITTNTVGGANEDLKEGNIIASEPTWKNGTASITLSKGAGVASNLTIQYQIGDITEGKWTTAQEGATSVSITGLTHNSIVYARLTDGTNYGSYASVNILDKVNPQQATINLSGTSTTTAGNIIATVTHIDNESGVEISNCKWVYNTNPNTIGLEPSSYPNTFSNNGQQITLSASTPGTYYLHVLTQDKAGNKGEAISDTITINSPYPTIEQKLVAGNYVYYNDNKNIQRKCIVLYGKGDSYSIQIITKDVVENLSLFSNNFEQSISLYNGAISNLNARARLYINTTYVTSARCVGSVPNNPNYDGAEMFTRSDSWFSSYNGKFKNTDQNFLTDWNQMYKLNILKCNEGYWLASRNVNSEPSYNGFNMRIMGADGQQYANSGLITMTDWDYPEVRNLSYGLRPVFTLKSGIRVTGGEGTENNPYTLGF